MNWIWFGIRVLGLTSYLLLTLSVLGGILRGVPKKKYFLLQFHQQIGQIALLLGGLHGFLLLFDSYEPYSLVGLLVPFASSYEPVLSGFGTIGLYLLLIVIVTSDFMKKIGRVAWKKAHYLAFPCWLLIWAHGLFMGTEGREGWALVMYGSTFLLVLFATIYMTAGRRKQNKPVDARSSH
ncbi:ferric reductase-like transmembrane domain-containing protein [Rossellomorea marisflavi]|uniref:ferric reductase-like transmembrane domain-containing protein n=1 Tax=Rossellomorea marisflavi TaxID=189381 RepID=UPI0034582B86